MKRALVAVLILVLVLTAGTGLAQKKKKRKKKKREYNEVTYAKLKAVSEMEGGEGLPTNAELRELDKMPVKQQAAVVLVRAGQYNLLELLGLHVDITLYKDLQLVRSNTGSMIRKGTLPLGDDREWYIIDLTEKGKKVLYAFRMVEEGKWQWKIIRDV